MFSHETFPNAPITEALIDLRVTFERPVAVDSLAKLSELFSESFPTQETQFELEYQVKLPDEGGGAESHSRSRPLGHVRFTANRDKAVQLRVNGFAFSKLKPYESWSALREEAQEHWETYKSALVPSRVTRLAVRYINRIELPFSTEDFQEYVLTGPDIAEGVPQAVAGFFFRIVIPNPEDRLMRATIASTVEKPDQETEVIPYIFDIDVFRTVDLDPLDAEIWALLEKLRDYKNLIFFLSTTEKAKDLFR